MVKVPSMAESITEGTISTLTKQIGEYIEADEELANIETDKIDVSANAPEAGVVTELLVAAGDSVTVGQDIARIHTDAKTSTEASKPPKDVTNVFDQSRFARNGEQNKNQGDKFSTGPSLRQESTIDPPSRNSTFVSLPSCAPALVTSAEMELERTKGQGSVLSLANSQPAVQGLLRRNERVVCTIPCPGLLH